MKSIFLYRIASALSFQYVIFNSFYLSINILSLKWSQRKEKSFIDLRKTALIAFAIKLVAIYFCKYFECNIYTVQMSNLLKSLYISCNIDHEYNYTV